MSPKSTEPQALTSHRNPHVKRWMSLLESRGIKKHKQCLVAGKRLVRESLAARTGECLEIIHPPHSQYWGGLSEIRQFTLATDLFRMLDLFGTGSPLLICKMPELETADLTVAPEGLELVCPLGDPTNLGAVIRSCCAFDVRNLILLEEAVHPFHPRAVRASSGAVFHQKLSFGPRIASLNDDETLRHLVFLDLGGEEISTWNWSKNTRLLVGEEGLGQPAAESPLRVSIPQASGVESLNGAVATAIALYAYRTQHPL